MPSLFKCTYFIPLKTDTGLINNAVNLASLGSPLTHQCAPAPQTQQLEMKGKISHGHFHVYSIIFSSVFLAFLWAPSFYKGPLFRSIHISIIHTAASSSPPQGGLAPHPGRWLTTAIKLATIATWQKNWWGWGSPAPYADQVQHSQLVENTLSTSKPP